MLECVEVLHDIVSICDVGIFLVANQAGLGPGRMTGSHVVYPVAHHQQAARGELQVCGNVLEAIAVRL